MNPTRRALCGLGIASVPLAMLGPRVFSAEQGTADTPDPFLAYLVEDTKRNCRLAVKPGRERAKHVRRVGANAEVLTAYLLSRERTAGIKDTIEARVHEEGVDGLAHRIRESWPGLASSLAADYGVAVPEHLEYATITTAIGRLRRYGCPRLGGVRAWFEREAARIEQWEGRPDAPVLIRQTPGNDFGPPGWSAGIGDAEYEVSCYEMGVLLAAIGVLAELVPEMGAVFRPMIPIMTLVLAVACSK